MTVRVAIPETGRELWLFAPGGRRGYVAGQRCGGQRRGSLRPHGRIDRGRSGQGGSLYTLYRCVADDEVTGYVVTKEDECAYDTRCIPMARVGA